MIREIFQHSQQAHPTIYTKAEVFVFLFIFRFLYVHDLVCATVATNVEFNLRVPATNITPNPSGLANNECAESIRNRHVHVSASMRRTQKAQEE